jgi:hypothetical protein
LLADHYKMLVDGLWMKGLISGGQLDN